MDTQPADLDQKIGNTSSPSGNTDTPGEDPTLKLAWERFAVYDHNAQLQRSSYNQLLLWILILGVVGTLLALTQKQLTSPTPVTLSGPTWWVDFIEGVISSLRSVSPDIASLLRYPIVIVPIATSVLLAAANRFKSGHKWVLLRASAEAIKREIFSYRMRAGIYSDDQRASAQASREAILSRQVEAITRAVSRTEVNSSALRPYDGPIPPQVAAGSDDGFTALTPDRYIQIRLGDQINFYKLKTNGLERKMRRLQWSIYIIGGAGTFLAAMGAELWIALTTAIVTAITAYLGHQQMEETLMSYNQAEADLENILTWWTALSAAEKAEPSNISKLVAETEKVLEGELAGWVRKMQEAVADRRQPKEDQRSSGA